MSRLSIVLPLLLLSGACASSQDDSPVRLDREGPNTAERWNATLNSPRNLEGVVEMGGNAWMLPLEGREATDIMIEVRNAAPGGEHPWEIKQGRCGQEGIVLGSSEAYEPLRIGDNGSASSEMTLEVSPDPNDSYHVVVLAAETNRDLIIACGNLAPPSN